VALVAPSRQASEASARHDRLVPLGVCVGAHGVHGDVRVKLHNPESELLFECERVLLREAGSGEVREVELGGCRWHKDLLLVELSGVDGRDAALSLRGAELYVPRSALPELDEGEHYLIDLIGLQVRRTDGSVVGEVRDVIDYPAAQVMCVPVEGGTLEIPDLPPYVVETRVADGYVVVDALEDLEPVPPRARKRRGDR
jgi:16S rRNA processing protein RimM